MNIEVIHFSWNILEGRYLAQRDSGAPEQALERGSAIRIAFAYRERRGCARNRRVS